MYQAISTKPVIILPEIDHSDFCPGFKVKGDLPSEKTQDEALDMISNVISLYLNLRGDEDEFSEIK